MPPPITARSKRAAALKMIVVLLNPVAALTLAMMEDTVPAAVVAAVCTGSATMGESLAMGSRYPLNQFQHAPAGGVPHGGTLDAGCVQ